MKRLLTRPLLTIWPLLLITLTVVVAGCGGGQRNEAEARMKKLSLLFAKAVEKNNLTFPDMSSPEASKTALQPVLTASKAENADWDETMFTHPSSGQLFVPNKKLSKKGMEVIEEPATAIAFYAPAPDGDERLVGYADGSVKWVKEAEWETKKKAGKAE